MLIIALLVISIITITLSIQFGKHLGLGIIGISLLTISILFIVLFITFLIIYGNAMGSMNPYGGAK